MIATVINVVLILLGSFLGLLFKNRISARFASGITFALGLCVLGIGISSMISTADTLCVIVCMVIGTLLGELIDIEKRMDSVGTLLRRKLITSADAQNSQGRAAVRKLRVESRNHPCNLRFIHPACARKLSRFNRLAVCKQHRLYYRKLFFKLHLRSPFFFPQKL